MAKRIQLGTHLARAKTFAERGQCLRAHKSLYQAYLIRVRSERATGGAWSQKNHPRYFSAVKSVFGMCSPRRTNMMLKRKR